MAQALLRVIRAKTDWRKQLASQANQWNSTLLKQ